MTKNLSNPKRIPGSMLQSFATVSGVSGLSMGFGVLQNIAIAGIIGATASKDAYDVASYLPQMMLYFFGLDLFRGISISLFSRLDVNKSEDPSKVFSTLLNGLVLVSILAIGFAEIFCRPLVRLVGPGVAAGTSDLALNLARFLIPTLGLIAIISLIGSILLAHHYYGLSEGLRILPKITTLVGVLVWGRRLDVWVLVISMIVGLLAELPVMFYFLRRCGLRYSLILQIKSPAIKSALLDAVPLGIGAGVIYVSEIIMQRTVSYGQEGTIACFHYSLMICSVLTLLVGRPIAATLAPRITRSLEEENYQASSSMLGKMLGLAVLIYLCCTSVVWVEAPIIVDVLLGRGSFTPEATEQTSLFLAVMFLGSLGVGIRMMAIGVLLARRRTKTVMVYCLIASAIRAGLAAGGKCWWGVYASAIAYAVGACVDGLLCILSAIWITRLQQNMRNFAKIVRWVVSCLIVLVLPVLPHLFYPVNYTEPLFTKLLYLGIVGIVTGLSFFVAAWVIELYTLERISNLFKRIF